GAQSVPSNHRPFRTMRSNTVTHLFTSGRASNPPPCLARTAEGKKWASSQSPRRVGSTALTTAPERVSYHPGMVIGGGDAAASPAFTDAEIAGYHRAGWWSTTTLSAAVRRNAGRVGERVAY